MKDTMHLRARLSASTLNENVLATQYAVRGDIVQLAARIAAELEADPGSHPFDKLVWCNIGNPQLLGQQPISYFRQVLALMEYPPLLDQPGVEALFPSDVLARARDLLAGLPGGVGAYSESAGAPIVRRMVADAITRRDGGLPADPDQIYMTDGASPAVHLMMTLLLRDGENDGIMVPIPQYPLYSATLTLYGGRLVPYMLDEDAGWGLDVAHLRAQLAAAREAGTIVRGLVVINPGNPTGQCLARENQEALLQFCHEEDMVLMADEVYQANVYAEDKSWVSFRRVAADMGLLHAVPLASLHSISKGFVGECGRRGGYMELTGVSAEVHEQVLKLASINLCPNLSGQVCAALMLNPPQPGDPSYDRYTLERESIMGSLKRRAQLLVDGLNALEGVTCNLAEGALYAFPRIRLPPAAVAEAKRQGKQPDWLYCRDLLLATGIVVVPGSGFGQADGTFHLRTTFLPSEGDIAAVVQSLATFHAAFMDRFRSEGANGVMNGHHN